MSEIAVFFASTSRLAFVYTRWWTIMLGASPSSLACPPILILPHSGGREALRTRATTLLDGRLPPPAWRMVRVGGKRLFCEPSEFGQGGRRPPLWGRVRVGKLSAIFCAVDPAHPPVVGLCA